MDIPQVDESWERVREHARLERGGGALVSPERVDAERAHGAGEAGVGDDAREDVRAALRVGGVLVARGARRRLVLEAQVVVPRAVVVVRVVVVVVVRRVSAVGARGRGEGAPRAGGEVEVELPEEELGCDAGERVRDEEERFEVPPREVQCDLAPDFVGDAFFEVVRGEGCEELCGWVGEWVQWKRFGEDGPFRRRRSAGAGGPWPRGCLARRRARLAGLRRGV